MRPVHLDMPQGKEGRHFSLPLSGFDRADSFAIFFLHTVEPNARIRLPTPDMPEAGHYRNEARRCRAMARAAKTVLVARRWHELADEYEQLAVSLERNGRLRCGTDN